MHAIAMINSDIALQIQNIALNLLTLQSTGGHTNWIATNFIVFNEIGLQCKDYLTFHLYWSTHNYYPDDGTGRCTLLNIGNFINVKDLSTLSLLQRSIDCEEREKPFFPHLLSSQSLSWLIVEKWKEILRKVRKKSESEMIKFLKW